MSDREAWIVDGFRWYPGGAVTPAMMARILSLCRGEPCPWCPVLPPKSGTTCARVPEASRRAVASVLRRMERAGLVRRLDGWRLPAYVLVVKEETADVLSQ